MNINFSNVKTNAINTLNSIGATAYTVKDKAADFASQAKSKIATNDTFVKLGDTLKANGVEKKTVVGGAVLLCALALAGKTVKGVLNKVKEMKAK